MSLSIRYDSSFDGFLSVVFEVYRQRLDVGEIVASRSYDTGVSATTDLFMQPFQVETCDESARRLKRAIVNAASEEVLNLLNVAFRSEEPGIEMAILAYLRKLFSGMDPNYGKNPASAEMLPLFKKAQDVRREAGGMLGMVRFNKGPEGLYIAEIEPKYDVLDLMVGHFRGRFPNGKWAILDVKRGFGAFYDGKIAHEVTAPDSRAVAMGAPPDEFTAMWKSYYDSMAIQERLNPRCLKRCLPVRYWKHMVERQPDLSKVFVGSGRGEARGKLGLGSDALPSAVAKRNSAMKIALQNRI